MLSCLHFLAEQIDEGPTDWDEVNDFGMLGEEKKNKKGKCGVQNEEVRSEMLNTLHD